MTFFAIIILLISVAAITGFLARSPSIAEQNIILHGKNRSVVAAFYMLRGPQQFMSTLSNYVTARSVRYGDTTGDLAALWNLMAIGIGTTACAMHLGWLWFDLNTYAGWRFFSSGTPFDVKLNQTAVFIGITAACILLACQKPRIVAWGTRALGGQSAKGLVELAGGILAAMTAVVLLAGYGNNGLVFLPAVILLTRFSASWALPFMAGVLLYKEWNGAAPALFMIMTYGCMIGLMAWIALRASVELYATANWFDVGNFLVVATAVATGLIAMVCMMLAPVLMWSVMEKLAQFSLLPADFSAAWADLAADLPRIGDPLIIVACFSALPVFFPFMGLLTYGMGAAIGNGMSAAEKLRGLIGGLTAQPTFVQMEDIIAARQAAYEKGYTIATVIAVLCASVLFFGGMVILSFTYWAL